MSALRILSVAEGGNSVNPSLYVCEVSGSLRVGQSVRGAMVSRISRGREWMMHVGSGTYEVAFRRPIGALFDPVTDLEPDR